MPTWIIETHLNDACEAVALAAARAGDRVVRWSTGDPVPQVENPVFLGSLTECGRMHGVIGSPERLRVSAWLSLMDDLALNSEVVWTTAGAAAASLVEWPRVFARPDSAMKPFAGRVLDREKLSPAALDLGFYFDDPALPVVLAPAVEVVAEWRFVAVERRVVAHSGYVADGRARSDSEPPPAAWAVATAALERSPEPTVVLDVCETRDGAYRLVELNLFSGADLYGCDADAVVAALRGSRGR